MLLPFWHNNNKSGHAGFRNHGIPAYRGDVAAFDFLLHMYMYLCITGWTGGAPKIASPNLDSLSPRKDNSFVDFGESFILMQTSVLYKCFKFGTFWFKTNGVKIKNRHEKIPLV